MSIDKTIPYLYFFFFLLGYLLTACSTLETLSYQYIDTNGNLYKISPDSLVYEPMAPSMSSSGMYDGGEPQTRELSNTQFSTLSQWMESALLDETHHLPQRVKPSIIIRRIDKTGKKWEAILSFQAPLRKELENRLQALLGEGSP